MRYWAAWLERRERNYLMFATHWLDPVESSHYVGYMGA